MAVHYSDHLFPLEIMCHHLVSATQRPIAFRFLNSVAAVPDIMSNLQRRVATDIFKNSESLLTTLFLTAMVKLCPLYPSGAGDQYTT